MRILQLCLKPPYPKADGGCIAMAAMTESLLLANHTVKVLCMSTHKHPFAEDKVPKEILSVTQMEAIEVDTEIKPLDAFLNLFSTKSYNIQRFENQEFEKRLIDILQSNKYDIVHVESLFCAPYLETIRKHSEAKIVLRAHNIEHQIWYGLANQESNPPKKWYLNRLANRLKRYELNVLPKFDAIIPITEEDKQAIMAYGVNAKMQVVPIGFDTTKTLSNKPSINHIHLYHLGAMDWAPNIEGIEWFIENIWPKINEELPEIKCSFAGRKMPTSILNRASGNLFIEGEVPSVSKFIQDKNVAIIPLLSGSGMRVKIIEALSFGKVVITTSLGATGIPYKDGENILIADTPEEMVEKLGFLSTNPEKITELSVKARSLAEQAFDLHLLSSKLTYFYSKL